MANEAQRLIAVSLGKISSSKGQRGGVNLRRNLLVANVIMKARTVYMMANYHKVPQTTQNDDDSHIDNDVQENTCATSTDDSMAMRNSNGTTSTTEPISITTHTEEKHRVEATPCDYSQECSEKENIDTRTSETVCDDDTLSDNSNYTTKCARCTKRRLSDVDSPATALSESNLNSSNTNDCGRAHKRAKVESSYTNDSIEDMQTDNVHISSLVNRFSEGFSGLLSLNSRTHADNASGNGACSSHSDGFTSCSTQIKDAYEAIAATPIALAV